MGQAWRSLIIKLQKLVIVQVSKSQVFPFSFTNKLQQISVPETPANLKKIFAKIVSTEAADKETKDKAFDALQELVCQHFHEMEYHHTNLLKILDNQRSVCQRRGRLWDGS